MGTYGCDKGCCWYFERLSYNWDGEPILSPQKISLAFRANLISITAGHFSSGVSCDSKTVKTAHPITGQEYTLTLHGCEQIRNSFAEIGAKGVVYPECCQILSYSIAPEIDHSLFASATAQKATTQEWVMPKGRRAGQTAPQQFLWPGKMPLLTNGWQLPPCILSLCQKCSGGWYSR